MDSFLIRVDVPEHLIKDQIVESGYVASDERVHEVLECMQTNYFGDKRGGCKPDEVEDYILSTAEIVIDDLIEGGEWD
jgi:hypothetical protein